MNPKPNSLKKQLVRSTSAQISLFVDYMAANKDFANGLGEYSGVIGSKKANLEWEALRERLIEHGADKTVLQWKQTWRDLKRKARRAVNENKGAMPIVSDATFKVLETIGPAGLDCSIDIQTPESCHWEMNSKENLLLMENGIGNKDSNDYDETSDKSSEPDNEDVKDAKLVEIIVPMPQIQDVFYAGPSNQPQHDPLQVPVAGVEPRLARLAPKVSPLRALSTPRAVLLPRPAPSSPSQLSRSPSITRRRQILMTRKRKPPNMYQQTSNEFVALEQRRLRMEEEHDRRLHQREMERLKLELQRIEVQRDHNDLLQHLLNIAQGAYELLQQKLH